MRWLLPVWLAVLGCAPEAGLHVVVAGDLYAGVDFDRLALEVRHGDEVLLLDEVSGEQLTSLPLRFNLLSGDRIRAGSLLTVTARAYLQELVVSEVSDSALLLSSVGEQLVITLPPVVRGDGGLHDAGTPHVAWVDAPAQLVVNRCSSAVLAQLRDAAGQPTAALKSTSFTFSAQPAGGVVFYADSSCLSQIVSRSITGQTQHTTLYWKFSTPGSYTVTATAAGRAPAVHTVSVVSAPPASLIFSSPSRTVQAGSCSLSASVEVRDSNGARWLPDGSVSVELSVADSGVPVGLFSDSNCASPTGTVVLSGDGGVGNFYFRGSTGGTATVSASLPGLALATQSQTVRPAVRVGSCDLTPGVSTVNCPVSPPQSVLSNSLLLFSAGSSDDQPLNANVACELASVSQVTCQRAGTTGTANISWQTAELPGANVRKLSYTCNLTASAVINFSPAVDPTRTFVLHSKAANGANQDQDDFGTVRLTSGTSVEIVYGDPCPSTAHVAKLQLVDLPGASVTRGTTGPMVGTSLSVTGLTPIDPTRTVLLFTWRWNTLGGFICQNMVRGEIDTATSLRFTLGAQSANCAMPTDADGGFLLGVSEIAWERVQLPAGVVQQHTVNMAAGEFTKDVPLFLVLDLSRSLAFSGGQSNNGQAGGETDYLINDVIGEAVAQYQLLSPSTLRLRRNSALGNAQFTTYTVVLEP